MATRTKRTARKKSAPKLQILRAKNLSGQDWLVHGFSTRVGGASKAYPGGLNLGFTKDDDRASVEKNRQAFLGELGASDKKGAWPVVTLKQVHSDVIHEVTGIPKQPLVGDGLVTSTKRLVIVVQTADCMPVLLADPVRKAVGAFHAGWRGTAARIVEKGVGAMRQRFGSRPEDLIAAVGPGIGSCCYEVGPEVRERFNAQFAYAAGLFHESQDSDPVREKYPLLFLTARAPGHSELPKKIFLDLWEANRRQLLDAGVPAAQIACVEKCTACGTELLFSHRAEKGKTGRLWGAIGVKPV